MAEILETPGSIELLASGPVHVRIDRTVMENGQSLGQLPPWRAALIPGADVSAMPPAVQDACALHWARQDVQDAWAAVLAAQEAEAPSES